MESHLRKRKSVIFATFRNQAVPPVSRYNFYRRFTPRAILAQAALHDLFGGNIKSNKAISWTSEALSVFQACKDSLAPAAIFTHPEPNSRLALLTDDSRFRSRRGVTILDCKHISAAGLFLEETISSRHIPDNCTSYLLGHQTFSSHAKMTS